MDLEILHYVCICVFGGLAVCLLGLVEMILSKRKRYVVNFSDIPLPQLTAFDGQEVECSCKHHCKLHDVVPESVVVGSNFTKVPKSKVPRVQAAIYSVDDKGRLVRYLGCGVRIADWFVAPLHVVVTEENIALVVELNGKPAACKIQTELFKAYDGDVAAVRLAESDFSQLGLVKCGIAPIESDMMVAICSGSVEPEMSFGLLKNDAKVFGGVVFGGSTRGGFSGAAYMIGKQLVGMHLGGGVMNYGVSASYVLALLQKPEETAEWLQRIRRKEGKLKYQRSKFNPDEAIVFVGGRYVTVDLDLISDQDRPVEFAETPAQVVPEINLSETFPPQYVDMVQPIATTVTKITDELKSKNSEMAEQCSAEQAQEFMKVYTEAMAQLDEKTMLLQSLQDSVSNRYRELQILLTQIPKEDEGRKVLVTENEKLKAELMEIKKLKTDVNVASSSVKAIPKSVKKAQAKKDRAGILEKLVHHGIAIDDVALALEEAGKVTRVKNPVAAPATSAGTTIVSSGVERLSLD